MDVWAFLNWLWGKIDKVLEWFGSSFNTWLGYLKNFFTYISNFGVAFYNQAVSWALDKINGVKAWVTGLYNYLVSLTVQVFNDVSSYARHLYNDAVNLINSLINGAYSYAVDLYHRAINAVNEAIAYVLAWASDRVRAARDYVIDLFDPLLALKPYINTLLMLTDRNTVNKLITFVQSLYGQVVGFFNDPLGFILGLIWTQAVTFFCFVLGYGMGSVNATLPPVPVWGKGGGGGGPIPPFIPPDGGGELGHPVDPLYVSGYTFGSGHHGADFGLVDGQDVRAAHSGVVMYAGWDNNGYGNRIDIQGSPYWTRYGHNKQVLVTVGQTVQKGQTISNGNSTGNSTGPHLHFELKVNGSYVDPLLYL